jgi:predicted Fe-Mo cluster-binding NifX family protein
MEGMMKLVITALGETLDSPVDQRFGRARYFIAYDTESGEWAAHDNLQNLEAQQGAGIQAAQKAVALGAEAVITGHCGPKAYAALSAGDIAVYTGATGIVRDAVAAMQAGRLEKSASADVGAHFGSA